MQRFPLFVALAGLALASSVLLARAAGRQVRHGPLYTVAQVQAGLAHQRGIWVGRTVRVRGSAVLCLSSDSQRDPQRCSRWPHRTTITSRPRAATMSNRTDRTGTPREVAATEPVVALLHERAGVSFHPAPSRPRSAP